MQINLKQKVKKAIKFSIALPKYLKSGLGVKALLSKLSTEVPQNPPEPLYQQWISENENYSLEDQRKESEEFKYQPLISILMPVYKIDIDLLEKAVESVREQSYPRWQLCIADDQSGDLKLYDYLKKLDEDERIDVVFRKENGGIAEATNSAFEIAKGEFIALLDDDDVLAPNALYEVVSVLNKDPEADLIYSDEDKLNPKGYRIYAHFKPDYAPDYLLGSNYICHFLVFRKSLLNESELLLNKEYDGAQDYDLVLRLVERTNNIVHIPKILYHWRMIPGSTSMDIDHKNYAIANGRKAVSAALDRRGLSGRVFESGQGARYFVEYDVEKPEKKVSIIIPTRDNPEVLKRCIDSILEKTFYPNYEIIVVNNNSAAPEALEMYEQLDREIENLKVIDLPIAFNYSKINNTAAREADGDLYLFLNDDTEVLTDGWLFKMVGLAQQKWIGAVGPKLLYPDGTIQHAGVVVGLLGIAGHVFKNLPGTEPGYFNRIQSVCDYTALTAACLLIEKDKFWQVGGFDEEIAVAFNDIDLCCKLAADGFYNVYTPLAELTHYESISRGSDTSASRTLRFDKEMGKMRSRWSHLMRHDPMYNPNLSLTSSNFDLNV